jgi:2-oxo-4-hydroxy-4-carboxy--5-ureidoimidazoline (OHCU) decarboxylase
VGTVATVLCVGAYFARDVWVARTREAWDNESEGVVRVMAETMDEVCGKETSGATVSVMEYKAALAEKMTPAQKLYIEAARKKLPIP